MVAIRFMAVIWAALLIGASLSLGAAAITTPHALQPHYSSTVSPDHDNCGDKGNQATDCQVCCQGIACASSGVLAQVAIAVPMMLSISRPGPGVGDHLFGRSIAPETGPPKLQA